MPPQNLGIGLGALVKGGTQGFQLSRQIQQAQQQKVAQAQQADAKVLQAQIKNLTDSMKLLDKDDPRRAPLMQQIFQLRGVNVPPPFPIDPATQPGFDKPPTAGELSRSQTLTGQNIAKDLERRFPTEKKPDFTRAKRQVTLINRLHKNLTDKQALLSTPSGQANAVRINDEITTLQTQIANQRSLLPQGFEDVSEPALLELGQPKPVIQNPAQAVQDTISQFDIGGQVQQQAVQDTTIPTATNPQTGQQLQFINGQWVPVQ